MQQKVLDNRYTILKELGTGATGNVYKVRDVRNNNIIALKILSKKSFSSDMVRRFGREFKLLAGLHHPNLCSVYDFGTLSDGRSYFTMEYIDGKNIFEFTKNLPYEKIYSLIVQLCRVLEYIHSKSLIHYDIKPSNILIAENREQGAEESEPYVPDSMPCVKLMDFGLAGEHQIKGGSLIKGTFPYIAPEVIKVLSVDHRADLYSLGVVLYEIFTRSSFQDGKESFVTLLKHRDIRASELPSKIVADIPEALEYMILKLLAPEPATRYNHANEIIREINKIGTLKFTFETEKTLEGYLLSSRFVGRDKEMSLLQTLYEQAQRGEGKFVLVTGDAGIGKTRLLKEFKIFTQLQRSHCFTGHAYSDKTQVLGPFYDIFSELINYVEDGPNLSHELKLSLAVLYTMFPDLTNGHLKRHVPRLASLAPGAEKLRNFEALSEFIRYCTTHLGELVVLLEDLHWADDLSIEFIEYLSRNLADTNVFICGTSREEELRENMIFKKIITHLTKQGFLTQIKLRPLKYRSLHSFLDSTITPGSNSLELVQYLMRKTGGNPYFVEEIMRTVLKKKKVSIGEHFVIKDLQKIAIPETIEEVVLKRVEDLDEICQEITKYAAVLLKGFNYDIMKRLIGLDDTDLSSALWELKRRQILIEEGNEYRFYHATLREALHKKLGYREKRQMNYRVGKTIESINRRKLGSVVEDLAYYFINARDRKKGIFYGLRAAKKCRARYANEHAVKFYKGVLNLLGEKETELRFDVLEKLGRVEIIAGHYDDMIKHSRIALGFKTGSIFKKIRIYFAMNSIYASKGYYKKVLQLYQKAEKLVKEMKLSGLKSLLQMNVKARICMTYLSLGSYKRACKFDFNTVHFPKRILKQKFAISMQANTYHILGDFENHKGQYGRADYDKVIFYYKEAIKLYKKGKIESLIGPVLNNLGILYMNSYDSQNALVYFHKSLKMSEKIGDQYSVSICLINLSIIFKRSGFYSKALGCSRKAFSHAKKIENPSVMAFALSEMSNCFLQLGNYKEAKQYIDKVLNIFRTSGLREEKIYAQRELGEIYQSMGDYSKALRFYRKALKNFKRIEYQRGIAHVLINIGSVLMEMGSLSQAKRYSENAMKVADIHRLKNVVCEYCMILCHINILSEDYVNAYEYYEKGRDIAEKLGLKRQSLQFYLLASQISYHKSSFLKELRIVTKSVELAKEMGTKGLYVEALLMKVKYEIKQKSLSKSEIMKLLDEATKIAEEIECPEIIWRVYFEYGVVLQAYKEYSQALEYYEKCIEIFKSMSNKIKNKSHRQNYLDRPDRKIVFTALDKIEKLL
jgi:serine/threonine protein kinase/tetratricopeptide (TPR) repeat protein